LELVKSVTENPVTESVQAKDATKSSFKKAAKQIKCLAAFSDNLA
jgi:hypothetical protein